MFRFLVLSLSLILTVTSFAAPGTASSQGLVLDFIKKTKLTQKSRKFEDLVRNAQTQMSKSDYHMWKDLSDKMPGLVVPKVQINKIKNNRGGEDLQIISSEGGQSSTIDVTQEEGHSVVKIVTTLNKKPVTLRLNTADGQQVMYQQITQFLQENGAFAAAKPSFQILKVDEIQSLTLQEKKQYFRKLQDMMEAAEKVQAAWYGPAQSASIWEMLLDPAQAAAGNRAADGTGCIVAGYSSTFKDGVCGKGDSNLQVRQGNEIQCNPAIFGSQAQWVSTTAAAGACTAAHRDVDSAFPRDIRNNDDFTRHQTSALQALESVKRTCETMKSGGRSPSAAQTQACADLRNRYADLAALQCKDLVKRTPGRFASLNCRSNPNDAVPVPSTPPVTDNQCGSKGCPRDQLTCPEGQRKAVDQCPNHFRCVCNDNQEPQFGDGQFERGCGPRVGGGEPRPPEPIRDVPPPQGPPPNENKRDSGGISPWVFGIGGLVVGGLLAWLLLPRKKETQYINVPNPYPVPGPNVPVPVPVPVPNPIPVPVPVPVPGPPYTPPVR